MLFPTLPNPAADRELEAARWHPERETLELAAAGAAPAGFSRAGPWLYLPAMPFPTMPDPIGDRERAQARRHPDQETMELAAGGAAQVLGPDHGVTKALAKAAITMDKADLWRARLAVKMLRLEQREAIAQAAES